MTNGSSSAPSPGEFARREDIELTVLRRNVSVEESRYRRSAGTTYHRHIITDWPRIEPNRHFGRQCAPSGRRRFRNRKQLGLRRLSRTRWVDQRLFQRFFAAAFFAISRLRSGVICAARALPPRLPSSIAALFFFVATKKRIPQALILSTAISAYSIISTGRRQPW